MIPHSSRHIRNQMQSLTVSGCDEEAIARVVLDARGVLLTHHPLLQCLAPRFLSSVQECSPPSCASVCGTTLSLKERKKFKSKNGRGSAFRSILHNFLQKFRSIIQIASW